LSNLPIPSAVQNRYLWGEIILSKQNEAGTRVSYTSPLDAKPMPRKKTDDGVCLPSRRCGKRSEGIRR
jgi:hypothetical protein